MGLWINPFSEAKLRFGKIQLWRYEMKFYFVDVIHVYEGRKGEIEIFYQVSYTFLTLLILNWLADVRGLPACDILSGLG